MLWQRSAVNVCLACIFISAHACINCSRDDHVIQMGAVLSRPFTNRAESSADTVHRSGYLLFFPLPLRPLCGTSSSRDVQRTAHKPRQQEKQVANVMSGRSSSNRGRRSHKRGGFDSGGGGGGGRSSGYSNRYSNEPPPRFKRNGDTRSGGSSDGRGGYEHYEDHGGRGSGSYSPHKNKQQPGSNSAPRSNFGEWLRQTDTHTLFKNQYVYLPKIL